MWLKKTTAFELLERFFKVFPARVPVNKVLFHFLYNSENLLIFLRYYHVVKLLFYTN